MKRDLTLREYLVKYRVEFYSILAMFLMVVYAIKVTDMGDGWNLLFLFSLIWFLLWRLDHTEGEVDVSEG